MDDLRPCKILNLQNPPARARAIHLHAGCGPIAAVAMSSNGSGHGGSKAQRKADVRARVVGEILASETSYITAMQALVQLFVVPLRSVLPPATHAAIFSNIQQLVSDWCVTPSGRCAGWLPQCSQPPQRRQCSRMSQTARRARVSDAEA